MINQKERKERLVRLSVRVSPEVVRKLKCLQGYTDKSLSLSDILREVIDEGLKAKK